MTNPPKMGDNPLIPAPIGRYPVGKSRGHLVDMEVVATPRGTALVAKGSALEDETAATRVQASIRGRQARAKLAQESAEQQALAEEATAASEDAAATRVQASIRGKQARAKLTSEQQCNTIVEDAAAVDKSHDDDAAAASGPGDEDAAATKVQASIRGRQARAKLTASSDPAAASAGPAGADDDEQTSTAADPDDASETLSHRHSRRSPRASPSREAMAEG